MKIKRCPLCRSRNLDYLPWLGQQYRCRKCKYSGPLFVEEKS